MLARSPEEDTTALDHKGLAIVAGEGLRGGGTIDRSRALALDVGGLEETERVHPTDAYLPLYDVREGQHFRVQVAHFLKTLRLGMGLDDIVRRFVELVREVQLIREEFKILGFYDTLPIREKVAAGQEAAVRLLLTDVERREKQVREVVKVAAATLAARERVVGGREQAVEALETSARATKARVDTMLESAKGQEERIALASKQLREGQEELEAKLTELRRIVK